MSIDVRFVDIHCVEDGKRRGLQVGVTARTDGGGCLDRAAMQELRGALYECLNSKLPKCLKDKGVR